MIRTFRQFICNSRPIRNGDKSDVNNGALEVNLWGSYCDDETHLLS